MAGMSLKKMARQMGIDMDELGVEGENMWEMLEDLSANDPSGYKTYIENMMEEKAEFDSIPDEPHFFPNPGYVIKGVDAKTGHKAFVNVCFNDGVAKPKNHAGREMTDDPRQPTDGMEIPMAVGAKREVRDHAGKLSLAIDVVCHSWVTNRAADDKFFKMSASDLALTWVKSEEGVDVKKPYKFIQSKYKGGHGKIGEKPVAFVISHSDPEKKRERNQKGEKVSSTQLSKMPARPAGKGPAPAAGQGQEDAPPPVKMDSPADLFKQLGDLSDADGVGSGLTELNIPNTSGSNPSGGGFDMGLHGTKKVGSGGSSGKKKKSLISEVNDDGTVDDDEDMPELDTEVKERIAKINSSVSTNQAPVGGAEASVEEEAQKPKREMNKKGKLTKKMKGFLNSGKAKKAKPLYEGKSDEGRPEHPWNKMMGRSQVSQIPLHLAHTQIPLPTRHNIALANTCHLPSAMQVIDMNSWTPEQQKAYSKTGNVPKGVPHREKWIERNGGVQNPNDGLDAPQAPKPAGVQRTDFGDAEFEELMNLADEDYGLEAKRKGTQSKEMDEELANWADMLSMGEKHDAEREHAENQKVANEVRQKELWSDPAGEKKAAELKKTLADANLAKKAKAKEDAEKSATMKRPGTLDYSKFEEMDEDTELITEDEKVARLRAKREVIQAKLDAQKEQARVQKAKADEAARVKVEKDARRAAGKRPGTLDYSKFDFDDEDEVELVDSEEAAKSRANETSKEAEARRKKQAEKADAECVRAEEARFLEAKRAKEAKKAAKKAAKQAAFEETEEGKKATREKEEAMAAIAEMEEQAQELTRETEEAAAAERQAQQEAAEMTAKAAAEEKVKRDAVFAKATGSKEPTSDILNCFRGASPKQQQQQQAPESAAAPAGHNESVSKKVVTIDAGTTAVEEEDEILELGADGSFDFDAPGNKPNEKKEPAFNFKGKMNKKKPEPEPYEENVAAVTSDCGPDAGAGGMGRPAAPAAPAAPKPAAKKPKKPSIPAPDHTIKRVKGDVAGTSKYSVSVELPGLTSMAGVELDVGAKSLVIRAKGYSSLTVPFDSIVDENRVVAKFSKKKRALSLKVPIL
jgi:hypothetical protein